MNYKALALELDECYAKMRHKPAKRKLADFTHGGEMFTLHIITDFGSPVSPGELSLECGVSTARIATTLKSLEAKGFINRETHKEDRRRTLVTVTDSGREASERFEAKRRAGLEHMLRELGEHDASEYVRLLRRVSEITARMHP